MLLAYILSGSRWYLYRGEREIGSIDIKDNNWRSIWNGNWNRIGLWILYYSSVLSCDDVMAAITETQTERRRQEMEIWGTSCLLIISFLLFFLIVICFPLFSFCLSLILTNILKRNQEKFKYGIAFILIFYVISLFLLFLYGGEIKCAPSTIHYAFIPLFFFLAGAIWAIFIEKHVPLEERIRKLFDFRLIRR